MFKFLSIFKKDKFSTENQKAAEESMASLKDRMNILNQKSVNLADKFPQHRSSIEECFKLLDAIEPSASVRAGKFEQQIAVAITKVSTDCDTVFTSADDKTLASDIKTLARSIRERQNADIVEEE